MDDTPVGAPLEAATGLGPVTGTSTLSVAGITRNEAESLRACLERVVWADEIVVVDAGSTDKTVAVAREFTDRVLFQPWTGSGAQKNFARDQGTGSWILFLDTDQRVPEPLCDDLRAVTRLDPPEVGFAMARWHVRLFRQGRGRFSARAVHESGSVDGPVGRLGEALVVDSYQEGVADFGTRTSGYSGLGAGELAAASHGGGVGDLTVRPRWRFARMYLLQGGFLGGWRGFVLTMLYDPYIVVRAAKVRELRAACPAGPGVAG
jgi:glycosyltransferase involved in cell wall biosynthesis